MVRAVDDGFTDGGAEQRLKIPPNSIEAEQALLGGLMLFLLLLLGLGAGLIQLRYVYRPPDA